MAMLAHLADEPLIDDAAQLQQEILLLNPKIHEALDHLQTIPRVQSGVDRVSGHGGAQNRRGCFVIADFSHEQHIWVLAEKGADTPAKLRRPCS